MDMRTWRIALRLPVHIQKIVMMALVKEWAAKTIQKKPSGESQHGLPMAEKNPKAQNCPFTRQQKNA